MIKQMARKRKSYKKARAKSSYSFGKKKARRTGRNSTSVKLLQLDSMAYGAIRAPISNFVMNMLSKWNIPFVSTFGNAIDEVAMGGLNYVVAKSKWAPKFAKNIAMKGLVIENARVGELGTNILMNKMAPTSATSGSNNTIYG